jgi:hypothetical protein
LIRVSKSERLADTKYRTSLGFREQFGAAAHRAGPAVTVDI